MIEIDAEDAALIDAEPAVVRAALVEELAGRTHWWSPYFQARMHGSLPADQVGGMSDVDIGGSFPTKLTFRVLKLGSDCIHVEYVGGAYRGDGLWQVEPQDGKTRLSFRWHVRPVGWTSWLLGLFPARAREARPHHEVMSAGFDALNRYLAARRGRAL